jgi:hypothetical protein
MRITELLQPLSIPTWKWEDINMDFIVGLPLIGRKFNSIWVIIDRLTKSDHSIPVHTFYRAEKYAELYVSHILCRRPSFLTEGPNSSLTSRSSCMLPWGRV